MITKHPTANLWTHENGRQTQTPPRDVAILMGSVRYDDGKRCGHCAGSTIRYTHNDRCFGCAQVGGILFSGIIREGWDKWTYEIEYADQMEHYAYYNKRYYLDRTTYDELKEAERMYNENPGLYKLTTDPCKFGHVGLQYMNGKCAVCDARRMKSPLATARRAGDEFYLPNKVCTGCSTRSQRRVSNNKCVTCHPPRSSSSPRQVAKREGQTWYLPSEPCSKCHQIAEKRVNNGECRGCTDKAASASTVPGAADRRSTAESVMMRDCPTMVLSKADAVKFGLKVYRTGEKCKNGHNAYRYVSTGTCIKCLRGG